MVGIGDACCQVARRIGRPQSRHVLIGTARVAAIAEEEVAKQEARARIVNELRLQPRQDLHRLRDLEVLVRRSRRVWGEGILDHLSRKAHQLEARWRSWQDDDLAAV